MVDEAEEEEEEEEKDREEEEGVKGQRKEKSVWKGQETGKERREEDRGVGWGRRSRAEDVMRKTPC